MGTAQSGASVDIYAKPAGSSAGLVWIGSAVADSTTGDWSKAVVITGSTTFIAKVGSMSSAEATVTVTGGGGKATCVVTAKAMGKGVVKVSVTGKPAKAGTFTVYVRSGSKWVKVRSWASTSTGAGSVTLRTGKGSKTFLVQFSQAGATTGSATVTVRVK
jgi:hypothetical protein